MLLNGSFTLTQLGRSVANPLQTLVLGTERSRAINERLESDVPAPRSRGSIRRPSSRCQ